MMVRAGIPSSLAFQTTIRGLWAVRGLWGSSVHLAPLVSVMLYLTGD